MVAFLLTILLADIPSLFNLVGSAAASIIASAFAIKTSIDENEPHAFLHPLAVARQLRDSTTSSHAGDNDANLSALHHLSRVCFGILYLLFVLMVFIQRRNYTSDTINL